MLLLVALPLTTTAQWITESYPLLSGWNAVYLNVDASHDSIDNLVWKDENNPIQEIWMWDPVTGTAQYMTDPSSPLTARSQWQQWLRSNVNIVTNQLTHLLGNQSYLVRTTSDYTWLVKGRPVPPSYQWTTSGENFIGFPVAPRAVTIDEYFASAPIFSSTMDIFRYIGGALTENNPTQVTDFQSVNVARGQAYWVRSPDFNNFYSPFKVSNVGAGIHYGPALGQIRITLANNTTKPLTVYLNLLTSEAAPAGQKPIADMPTILVRGGLNSTNLVFGYTTLNGKANFPVRLQPAGLPDSTLDIVLGLNRADLLDKTPGDTLAAILRLTDETQLAQIDLPVSAVVPTPDGIWVGKASVTGVDQYLDTYYTARNNQDLTNVLRSLKILTNTVSQGTGLLAEYWKKDGNNESTWFYNRPDFSRIEQTVNLAGITDAPSDIVGNINYGARWSGFIQTKPSSNPMEFYTFTVLVDEKVRLKIIENTLVDFWANTTSGNYEKSGELELPPGEFYKIDLQYNQVFGSATCKLYWESYLKVTNSAGVVSKTILTAKQIIPKEQLYNRNDPLVGYKNGNRYAIHKDSGNIMELTGTSGAYLSQPTTIPNASVPKAFDLRLILHSGSNAFENRPTLTLLQHVYVGLDPNGKSIVTTTTNLLDRSKLATARRISSTHFPWKGDNENTGWASRSDLLTPGIVAYGTPVVTTVVSGPASAPLTNKVSTVGATHYWSKRTLQHEFNVNLDYNDQAANPFVHAYHPDHDNLDFSFMPIKKGDESFHVKRTLLLTMNPPENTFQGLTMASGKLQGNYAEQIRITDDGVKTRSFFVTGFFVMNRINETSVLLNSGQTVLSQDFGKSTLIGTAAGSAVQGSVTNVLVPVQGVGSITLNNLSYVYDKTAKAASATTTPAGLPVTLTYNGSTISPTLAGTYIVEATVRGAKDAEIASTTANFVIQKAPAQIAVSNVNLAYDGTPRPVRVTTVPAGLPVVITYNGLSTVPTGIAGTTDGTAYAVIVTVNDPNYQGSATATLTIR